MIDRGEIRLTPLVVSRFSLDGGAMFGVIPRELWKQHFCPDNEGRIHLVARILLVQFPQDERVVLVDAGLGLSFSDSHAERLDLDTSMPGLTESLAAVGVSPVDVTDGIMTHLHFDHAGGWSDAGRPVPLPLFPRATHHVQRRQWDWAMAPSRRDQGSFDPSALRPLGDNGRVSHVDGNVTLFPGLELITLEGHTPGMQIPLITGASGKVAYLADLVPTSAHARLPWIMAFDLQPLITLEEKQAILSRAVEEEWIVVLEHDPNIEAARVVADGSDFRLEPCACPLYL